MTTEEKVRFVEGTIIKLIDTYGVKRFVHGLIMWYGCRSLVDNGELAEIEKKIKDTKED